MDQQRPESNNQSDVALAQAAADGDAVARKTVSDLADPLIVRKTELFCKRFCYDHRFRYSCTLPHGWAKVQDAPYCEWGNASYAWMLEDLTSESRLQRFEGADGARLVDYLGVISHSQPFYERWKDWRFGRRVRAPSYIQELGPDSVKLFLWMRDGDDIANMAQRLGKSDAEATAMASQIVIELTQRNRLHLLDPPKTESLTGLDRLDEEHDSSQADIAIMDDSAEDAQIGEMLLEGIDQLDPVEQYVIEAMVVEDQDAEVVLAALKRLDISIKKGVPADKTNKQQLYYFRRKTIAKLAKLSGLTEQ